MAPVPDLGTASASNPLSNESHANEGMVPVGTATITARPVVREGVSELRFPANSVVVLAGIPGAGKSTLLRRLFADTDVRVLDSERLRNRWMPVLGAIPYAWWRPFLHLTHYLQVLRAIRAGGPLVVHECATRPLARHLIGHQARRYGLAVHLLLLDVPDEVARAGQQARGRIVRPRSMATHTHRWPHLLRQAADNPHHLIPGAQTAQVLTRSEANQLEKLARPAATAWPSISSY